MRKICSSLIAGLAGGCFVLSPASGFEPGLSESEGVIRTWHKEDGLLADSVTAILQTRDGFLWVGTSGGLARFDGVKFTEVKLVTSSTNNPIWVTALSEDIGGHLWIGTQDGLFQLGHGIVQQYTKAKGLLDDKVTSLAADGQGFVWIGTKSGLNLFTGKEFKSFTVRDGLPDELVSGVHVARSGMIWITTRGGMCRFVAGRIAPYELQTGSQGRSPEYLGAYEDRRGNLWAFGDTYLVNLAGDKRFNYFRGNEAASVRMWSLCEGRDGRLWIGTTGRGLFCLDDDRFQPVILDELRAPYDVRAICEDREGNLWLGTSGGGLVQLRPQPVHVLKAGQGLPSGSPTALALDGSGGVLVGLGRSGLFVGEAGRFERFGRGDGLKVEDFVTSLCVSRDEAVWAGTLGGGLYGFRNGRGVQFTTANGLADDAVLSVCVDAEGHVWAATSAGTVHEFMGESTARYDVADGLTGSPVTVLIPSSSGGLWLGTEDGSILRGRQGKFVIAQPAEKVRRRPILALQEGEPGRLWIGTAGGGLACLVKGASASWNISNGLPNDVVAGVLQDAAKNLWLATGAGIYRVSSNAIQMAIEDPQASLVCRLVSDARTAFESTTVFGGARALVAPDGKLWFATSEGLLNVDTRRREIEASPLPVYIESVAFNGQPPLSGLRGATWSSAASNDAPAVMHGDLRSVEIQFTALSYAAPEKIRFRHKLDGFDSGWVDDAAARVAHYERLPYGRYRFRVAARNADSDWQEAATPFAFIVPTPLYFQAWAIFLYGASAVALVAAAVRVVSHRRLRFALAKLEQQQSLERERMRIARDMHDEIGSKLTKLSFLSEHAQMNAKASGPLAGKLEAIAGTSRELLQTMDEIVWVVNPRNDTLEHLAAYLSHYASEYFQNTTVECDIRLPRTIPDHPLSSEARHNLFLAFKETLNNVLKHASASKVKIEMSVSQPGFEISVADNGRGFGEPASSGSQLPARDARGGRNGNGLRNMRQRLADIGGECLIHSQPGRGTTVSMRIHLNNNTSTHKP
jgi:ligand-binding sensor domain-containing protein/signal transduction histidine kinase